MTLQEAVNIGKEQFFWFHSHPELSLEEYNTTKRIHQVLSDHGIAEYDLGLKTGTVAKISGDKNGPIIAFRCDIDALPIEEKTGLPYRSAVPGVMHACGHDFHAATLLGIALYLKDREKLLPGTVKLVFQPAEETADGAKLILGTGILHDVDVIFGLHCSPAFPRGTIVTRAGFMHGAVDTYRFVFHGKGSHACRPQLSQDPVIMVSEFVGEAQTVISRNINPFHPALVSITHIGAGEADNVIPETGFAEGTARTVYPADRALIRQRLTDIAENIAASHGGTVQIDWRSGPPATDNDKEWTKFIEETAKDQGLPFHEAPDSLAGEDFAYYEKSLPGSFFFVGTGIAPLNHNPKFFVDPEALHESVAFGAAVIEKALHFLAERRQHD